MSRSSSREREPKSTNSVTAPVVDVLTPCMGEVTNPSMLAKKDPPALAV